MRFTDTDPIPLQLGPKVPSTAVSHEREQASAQAFARTLFEAVDLGRLVGITEAECRQNFAAKPWPLPLVRYTITGKTVTLTLGDGALELDARSTFTAA